MLPGASKTPRGQTPPRKDTRPGDFSILPVRYPGFPTFRKPKFSQRSNDKSETPLHTANGPNRRCLRLLKIGVVLGVAWAAAAAGLCIRGLTLPVGQADVAVVFGNALAADGTPKPILHARLESAIQCYRSGKCPRLFVSGSIDGPGLDEAAAMRN